MKFCPSPKFRDHAATDYFLVLFLHVRIAIYHSKTLLSISVHLYILVIYVSHSFLRYIEAGPTKARASRAAARTPTYMEYYDVIGILGNMVLVTAGSTSDRVPPKNYQQFGHAP